MFRLNEEFDYGSILQSCCVQDEALTQSTEERISDAAIYRATVEQFLKAKEKYLERQGIHQQLLSKLQEKLNVANTFEQLKKAQNAEKKKAFQDINSRYETMVKDSDKFGSDVKETVNKFEKLGAEFDENTIAEEIAECAKKKCQVLKTHQILEGTYSKVKDLREDSRNYPKQLSELTKIWGSSNKKELIERFTKEDLEYRAQLSLVDKNIDFLKKRIAMLKGELEGEECHVNDM